MLLFVYIYTTSLLLETLKFGSRHNSRGAYSLQQNHLNSPPGSLLTCSAVKVTQYAHNRLTNPAMEIHLTLWATGVAGFLL